MASIGIVGFGHVGKSMQRIFPGAVVYDPFVPAYAGGKTAVNRCELVFVCVPTPSTANGAADTSIVEEVVSWLESDIIVVKSTVTPGTTDRLRARYAKRVVFSPEYVGESQYHLPEEFQPASWPFVIVGGEAADTKVVVQHLARTLGPAKIYRQTSAKLAELCKYMENTWLAAQVTFANQFYDVAERENVDYYELRELWALDPRVSRWHTAVFSDNRGFGGKCLPKDLAALAHFAQALGLNTEYLKGVQRANAHYTASSQPYEDLI